MLLCRLQDVAAWLCSAKIDTGHLNDKNLYVVHEKRGRGMTGVSRGKSLTEQGLRSVAPKGGGTIGSSPFLAAGLETERLRFLDSLKATGIVMVVAIHALTRVEVDTTSHDLIAFLVGPVAVPLFFLADGYLLSWKWTNTSHFKYKSFIRKSALRLLIPWAAFTVCYAALRVILEKYELTRETILLGKDFVSVVQVIYLSDVSPHMYFLLSLFLVRLGAYGYYKMLRWSMWIWIAVGLSYAGLFYLSHPKDWFFPGADPVLLACWGGQFYLLGIVLQKGQAFVSAHTGKLFALCAGITIALRFLIPVNMGIILQMFYLVSTYMALLFITDRTRWSFSMGMDSMGIYLLHAPIVLWGVAAIVTRIVAPGQVLAFGITTCVTVLVSWFGAWLMNKSRVGRLLLGRPGPIQARS